MHVLGICATHGRHQLLERSVRLFLNQDYTGEHTLLIYNNSPVVQNLDEQTLSQLPYNKRILLVNNHIDSKTGGEYTSLGAIYNDILNLISPEYDVVYHHDDDDLYLPTHISEGIKGLNKAWNSGNYLISAYKPLQSYYRSPEGICLTTNVLEPSIFIEAEELKHYGYSLETTQQHLQWVEPLRIRGELFVDPKGAPTLIYNWGDVEIETFKTSGDFHNPHNFHNYRDYSRDHGDQVITPWPNDRVQIYYNLIKNVKS